MYGLGPIETCKSDANHADLHAQNERWEAGTHGHSLFWSKSRCFASKIQSWGGKPIETNNSEANHAVLNAKTTDEGWDP